MTNKKYKINKCGFEQKQKYIINEVSISTVY